MTRRIWSRLIAGVGLIAVATAAAATLEHPHARPARAVTACDTNYDLASAPTGEPVSVTTVTCKRPAAPIVSSPL
jgi:hypothetical protein